MDSIWASCSGVYFILFGKAAFAVTVRGAQLLLSIG
jgi:hypothetical protein